MTGLATCLDPDEAASPMAVLLAELAAGAGVFNARGLLRTANPTLTAMRGLPAAATQPGAALSRLLAAAGESGLLTDPRPAIDLFAAPTGGNTTWIGFPGRRLEPTMPILGTIPVVNAWPSMTIGISDSTGCARAAFKSRRSSMPNDWNVPSSCFCTRRQKASSPPLVEAR